MRKARKTRRQVLFLDVVDAWVPEEGRSLKVIHALVLRVAVVKGRKQEKGEVLLCDVVNDPAAGKRPLLSCSSWSQVSVVLLASV